MSWRDLDRRRRARGEVEARRYEQSEGVGLRRFIRLLLAPAVVVVALVVSRDALSKPVRIALGALALVLLLGLLKATSGRADRATPDA